MYVYLLSIATDAETLLDADGLERLRSVAQGVRRILGQPPDFVLGGTRPMQTQTAQCITEVCKSQYFSAAVEALGPGADPAAITKELNKLIGKEKLLVIAPPDLWAALAHFLTGAQAPDASSLYTMAEIYIKGFPGPGQGVLNTVYDSGALLGTS